MPGGALLHLLGGVTGAVAAHCAQALFAAGEMAHVNADTSRLRALAGQGVSGAAAALELVGHPERLLTASLIGSGVAITTATFFWGHALGSAGLPAAATAAAAIPATLATEVLAKGLARSRPETLAPLLSRPLTALGRAGAPLYLLARALRRGGRGVRRAELAMVLRERGSGGGRPLASLFTVLRLSRVGVARAAQPLTRLEGLPEQATVADLAARAGRRTRMALLDAEGRPTGRLVSLKTALGADPATPLARLAVEAARLSDQASLSRALDLMRGGGEEFLFLTRGAAITGFTTQYDCSRLLLRELPQE